MSMPSPTQGSQTVEDALARIVMLVYGKMDNGGPYWSYVAVRPTRYDQFTLLWRQGGLNMQYFEREGFGEVIVSGDGVVPPPDVTKKVAAMFNTKIRDVFGDLDARSVISQAIEKMKKPKA